MKCAGSCRKAPQEFRVEKVGLRISRNRELTKSGSVSALSGQRDASPSKDFRERQSLALPPQSQSTGKL